LNSSARHPGKSAPALRSQPAPAPESQTQLRLNERAAAFRLHSPSFAAWAAGYGTILHGDRTQVRVHEMAHVLVEQGAQGQPDEVFELLAAADRIASAAIWLILQMTLAGRSSLENSEMDQFDRAEGRQFPGDYLHLALAYTGYLAANALTGQTRSWVMAQAHCAPAIEVVNLLAGNLNESQQKLYSLDDSGLNRFAEDFFPIRTAAPHEKSGPRNSTSSQLAPELIESFCPQGAHYYYPHAPLKGERLVVFLDHETTEHEEAFAPRWWRKEDCGLIAPFLLTAIRRTQEGSEDADDELEQLQENLQHHGYDPIDIRAGDPSAYAWAIIEMERRLINRAQAVTQGNAKYPILVPCTIAELPHGSDPSHPAAWEEFLESAKPLFVPREEINHAAGLLNKHEQQGRVPEREHPLAARNIPLPAIPELPWKDTSAPPASMIEALDLCFSEIARANPKLRPRVGYAESRARPLLPRAIELLKFRTTSPKDEATESLHGAVISGVPPEAALAAALANKAGLNLGMVSESAAPRLLAMLRQEIKLARHQFDSGRPPGWLGIPVVIASELWESGTELTSCHTTAFCESLLGETGSFAKLIFPADWNSTVAVFQTVHARRGEIWVLLAPKANVPVRFTPEQTVQLIADGAIRVRGERSAPLVIAVAGAHQLGEAVRACDRLAERGTGASLAYLLEPGRFRAPRDAGETGALASPELIRELFPREAKARIFATHFRPELALGMFRPLDTGPDRTRALGFIHRDETEDGRGMLHANRCTWAHLVMAAAEALHAQPGDFLTPEERESFTPQT
jgi:phosphoketolase